jgi:hypothetical protein
MVHSATAGSVEPTAIQSGDGSRLLTVAHGGIMIQKHGLRDCQMVTQADQDQQRD